MTDIIEQWEALDNKKVLRNYRNLMDEIDALIPYEEREYKEEEDTGEDRGCWENGGTIDGLLAYITRIRDENQKLHAEIETLKLCVTDRDEYAADLKGEIKTLEKMIMFRVGKEKL